MSDPLVPNTQESKVNAINRKIVEIKKKIQLSEGQRKATFEECDAKKKENAGKVSRLKKEVKELQVELTKAKNNDDAAERAAQMSRESAAYMKKRSLEEAISKLDEDNIRFRKQLDLVRYESDEQQKTLKLVLEDYEELMNGTIEKFVEKKLENPAKKKIVSLENQLHRISVMQMEADTVRKKYRGVRSSLKADAAFFASSLKTLEDNIGEQEGEIKRLQGVKEEAINLRDITRETLMKQESEASNTTKNQDCLILDYRQRVENRKLELERLERMIFPTGRQVHRDDFEGTGEPGGPGYPTSEPGTAREKTVHLEEAFAKLRHATGVTRTEDVLNRFLGQQATKDRLQKMRAVTEEEKTMLEKRRQQLSAEIDMQKFSETKDSDQNAEELEKLNRQIAEQQERQAEVEAKNRRVRELLTVVTVTLWCFCDKLRDMSETPVPEEAPQIEGAFNLLEILFEKMECTIERVGGPEKCATMLDDAVTEKFETVSITTTSGEGRMAEYEDRPLFPRFPSAPTPAAPAPTSEDEEEVPTPRGLKRQAQLLVDAKSRRKGFNFRR